MCVRTSRCIALGYAVASLALSGCSFFSALDEVVPDNTMEYRRAETLPPLDIPPDLSAEAIQDDLLGNGVGAATYLEYQEHASNPLMEIYGIEPAQKPRLEGEGEQQRLVLSVNQEKAWERIRGFWLKNDLKIEAGDARLGFMDVIDPSSQSGYRVRVVRGEAPQTTAIYLEQRSPDPNPRQEEIMLHQLAEYLGTLHAQELARTRQSSQSASPPANQVSMLDGGMALQMGQRFSHAWHQVGLVLDSNGFAVEDRNRSRGIYYIRYDDPFAPQQDDDSGWLSKLAFWEEMGDESKGSRYQIKLISDGAATRVVILDSEGRRDESETAKRLLSLLSERLTDIEGVY